MSISDDAKAQLDNACQLAATMSGYTVRNGDPTIRIDNEGRVVVGLVEVADMDAWVGLCSPKTRTGVTTDSSKRTITFRP